MRNDHMDEYGYEPAPTVPNRFLRNKDLIKQERLSDITIIGAGGIGSFVIQSLTMMGWKSITTYDNDVMENHNISSTCYPIQNIGVAKVSAGRALHSMYAEKGQMYMGFQNMFSPDSPASPRMIVCTDNMESRRMVFNKWFEQPDKDFFVDARMGATTVELVTESSRFELPNDYLDTNYMNKRWQPTHTVPEAPCSMKHSVFATQHIASLVTSQLHNLVAGLAYYDYIWTSLSPNSVQLGTLIRPIIINSQED